MKFTLPIILSLLVTLFLSTNSAEAQVIPGQVKVDSLGRYPTNIIEQQEWNVLKPDSVFDVFQCCHAGAYYVGFQLEHDLGNKNTTVNWAAHLEISLRDSRDTTLWTKSLDIGSSNQNFITTIFHNDTIRCTSNYTYKVKARTTSGTVPTSHVELKILFFKVHEDFDRTADIALTCVKNDTSRYDGLKYNDPVVQLGWTGASLLTASEYDLEWVFIDSLEHFKDSWDPFKFKEPAGITTTDKKYDHQLFYPGGRVWYRVRAVGYKNNNPAHRIVGDWATCPEAVAVSNLDSLMTWQAQTVFTEDGKYKKAVKYYDPGLREVQSLVNLSTDKMTVVGETMYDFEGRPSLTMLPVPVGGNRLKYKPNFNPFVASEDVGDLASTVRKKYNYDNGPEVKNSTVALDSGAGFYYSANNIHKKKNNYLPNANGYVYSQTEYSRDGRSVVTKQAGVGEVFSIDGDHATKHFYGQSAQTELYRLFGNNVGNAAHYKKHITVDNNGQVSVAYIDQEGRTIATSLAGDSPNNLTLLASNKDSVITEDISSKNRKENNQSITTHKILNVMPNTEYVFNSTLKAYSVDLGKFGCRSCIYDLKIVVTNSVGRVELLYGETGNESGDHLSYKRNGISTSEDSCNSLTSINNIIFKFSAALPGEYTITKVVTPRPLNYQDVRTKVLASTVVQTKIDSLGTAYSNFSESCSVCLDGNTFACRKSYEQIEKAIEEIAELECVNLKLQAIAKWKKTHTGEPTETDLDTDVSDIWCDYKLCVKDKQSDMFDRQMSRIPTWTAAKASKYDNPLKLDPFFKPGLGLTGASDSSNMRTRLNAITFSPDGVNSITGSINRITDPAMKEFYVDKDGKPDFTNGFHVLYYNLMSTKGTSPTEIDKYNKKLDTAQWVFFRNFYMEAKRYRKLNLSGSAYATCDSARKRLTRYDLPKTSAGIKTYMEQHGSVVEAEIDSILLSITKCKSGLTQAQKDTIEVRLKKYFYSDKTNFLHYIIKEDSANSHLVKIKDIIGLSCIKKLRRPRYMFCAETVLAYNNDNLIRNYDLRKTGSGCSGSNITAICYDGWRPENGIPSTLSAGELLLDAKCAPLTYMGEAISGSFKDPLVRGKVYIFTFKYRRTPVGYGADVQYIGASNSIRIDLADDTDTYTAGNYDFSESGCVRGKIANPQRIFKNDATEDTNEFFLQPSNSSTDFTPVTIKFRMSDPTATKFYITVSTSLSDKSGALFKDFKLESFDEVCVKYHTFAPFDYKVNWDSVAAKCSRNAAAERALVIEYAKNKLVEQQMTEYYSSYKCLNRLSETFNYTYNSREYHYTLYYYDQAGNLVQTVPPKGVDIKSPDNPSFVSRYRYNSFNQVAWQKTPDAGVTDFWYNNKSQLRLSRNAQQLEDSTFAYTKYDSIGRVREVGLLHSSVPESIDIPVSIEDIHFPLATDTLSDITWTYYDLPANGVPFRQENLRNRVSYTEASDGAVAAGDDTNIKTYFSYDVHGNVNALRQEIPGLHAKTVNYVYDLVSNKVNYVFYQFDSTDQFTHRYIYDADNRIKEVYTSTDRFLWNREAKYSYYDHGPLARTEYGEHRVQGQDYYYTLQGWLKGVNMPYIKDPGGDGVKGSMVGKDVTAFTLGYYDGDYAPIKAGVMDSTVLVGGTGNMWRHWEDQFEVAANTGGLYNGNISWMVTDLAKQGDLQDDRKKGMQAMVYRYDQLNRITRSRSLTSYNGLKFDARSLDASAYDEDYSYDGNGNLLTLQRHDNTGVLKDDFDYKYYGGTNRLLGVRPINTDLVVSSGAVSTDNIVYRNITLQGTANVAAETDVEMKALQDINLISGFTAADDSKFFGRKMTSGATYEYDAIGNLIVDNEKGVQISWTPQGKVRKVDVQAGASVTTFRYDAMGNRVEKKVVKGDTITITRYLRDASGNVMSIYNDTTLIEQPIYGSSRLGQYIGGGEEGKSILGLRRYELTNHLDNVLSVISDKIYLHGDTVKAFVMSTSDYYPFGLAMEGRAWSDSTASYRYGFNSKEKGGIATTEDNSFDYGFRIYNSSIGKFLSVDPLTKSYPMLTPFQYSDNSPIANVDLDGAEKVSYTLVYKHDGSAFLKKDDQRDIISNVWNWDTWSFERKINNRLDINVKHPYRGNFFFANYTQMADWLRNPDKDYQSWEEGELLALDLATIDFAIPGKLALSSFESALFRGTSEGYAGNVALQKLGLTPASTDPAVATIFATEASNYGKGILYIATKGDLEGAGFNASANVLQSMEKEVATELAPLEFAQRASLSITAQEARDILGKMGISIPSKINKSDINTLLKEVPKLSSEQIETFYNKAVEKAASSNK